MRKVLLSLAALATIGIAMPAVTTAANAETVVIKKHRDHGWHNSWRHRHDRVVVREGWRHRHHRDHTVGVVVR
jgi:hypothetical protein